jgi:tetratricopeptide (TPR) repeat protein
VPIKVNAEKGEGVRLKQMYAEHVTGYPRILFVDSAGQVLEKIDGYMEPDDFAWKMADTLQKLSGDRLQKELKEKPNDVGLLTRLSVMQAALKDVDSAVNLLSKAEEANAKKPDAEKETARLLPAYKAVGGVYFQKQEYETAIPYMQKYIAAVTDPRAAISPRIALSLAYIETSQADLAIKELENVLKMTELTPPDKATAQALMTRARKDAGLE